ncbi:MAG: peptide chain release factor N(5)-glutamine methyltransferase [bacterium]
MAAKKDCLWTILGVLEWTGDFFRQKGIERGRFEAERLLAHVIGCERLDLYLNFDQPLSPAELSAFRQLVTARAKREPLQYLTGFQEFWSLPFEVGPDVLVPRPDSERLIEILLETTKSQDRGKILDLGTGSGALAVAASSELPDFSVYASDLSRAAVRTASANAEKLEKRVSFAVGNWLEMFQPGSFDFIISNPPYIRTGDFDNLMPEVRNHEPRLALDGGADGLECYRKIIRDAPGYLKPAGVLLLEIGCDQAVEIKGLFQQSSLWKECIIYQDYAKNDRVATAKLREVNDGF